MSKKGIEYSPCLWISFTEPKAMTRPNTIIEIKVITKMNFLTDLDVSVGCEGKQRNDQAK